MDRAVAAELVEAERRRSKTFEVTSCTPRGESGLVLDGAASGGFTIQLRVADETGTLVIGGGNEEDWRQPPRPVRELSLGDAGEVRGSGVFTPSPSGRPDFTIAGR